MHMALQPCNELCSACEFESSSSQAGPHPQVHGDWRADAAGLVALERAGHLQHARRQARREEALQVVPGHGEEAAAVTVVPLPRRPPLHPAARADMRLTIAHLTVGGCMSCQATDIWTAPSHQVRMQMSAHLQVCKVSTCHACAVLQVITKQDKVNYCMHLMHRQLSCMHQ